jgi:hypothetical protein
MKRNIRIAHEQLRRMTDHDLIVRHGYGNCPEALPVLLNRHRETARRLIIHYCHELSLPRRVSLEAQEEVDSLLFIAATHYDVARTGHPHGEYRTYMGEVLLTGVLQIARAFNRYQRHFHRAIRADVDCDEPLAIHSRLTQRRSPEGLGIGDPQEPVDRHDLFESVEKVLCSFGATEQAFGNAYLADVPRQLLARQLGVSVRSVEYRFKKLFEKLRKHFGEEEQDP